MKLSHSLLLSFSVLSCDCSNKVNCRKIYDDLDCGVYCVRVLAVAKRRLNSQFTHSPSITRRHFHPARHVNNAMRNTVNYFLPFFSCVCVGFLFSFSSRHIYNLSSTLVPIQSPLDFLDRKLLLKH